MSNHTLTVVAKIEAKAAHRETVKKALMGLIAPTMAEEGCINYDLHQDHNNTRLVSKSLIASKTGEIFLWIACNSGKTFSSQALILVIK